MRGFVQLQFSRDLLDEVTAAVGLVATDAVQAGMGVATEVAEEILPVPSQSFGGPDANNATARAAQAEQSGVLAVVEATPAQQELFKERLADFPASLRWDADAEAFASHAREAVEAVLTEEQLAVVRGFGDNTDDMRPSVLLLRGLGVDDDLPPTTVAQEHAGRVAALRKQGGRKATQNAQSKFTKDGQVTEAWTVGVLSMWPETDSFRSPTSTPNGHVPEHVSNSVRLGINQVVPVQGKETMFANYGSRVNLSWHRDGGADVLGQEHEHTLPSKVALFCVRHDHEKMAETHFVDNRTLCSALSPDDLDALTTEPVLFKMRDTDNVSRTSGAAEGLPSFQLDDDTLLAADKHRLFFKQPHPCIGGTPEWPVVSIQQDRAVNTSMTTPRAAAAYERLRETASEVGFALKLEQGDLCIVNNNGALHGRSAYPPRFDGEDRWLQRLSTHVLDGPGTEAQMAEDYFRANLVSEMQATQRLLKQQAEHLSELEEELKAAATQRQRQQQDEDEAEAEQGQGGASRGVGEGRKASMMFGAAAGAVAAAAVGLIRSRL